VLVRILFGVRIRDINFAFKLCRRRVLDRIKLVSEGSFIDAELVVRTVRTGGKVVQFGVDYFPRTRGVSTLSSPSVIVKILRELLAIRQELQSVGPEIPPAAVESDAVVDAASPPARRAVRG